MGRVPRVRRAEDGVMEFVQSVLLGFMLGFAIATAEICWEIVRDRWMVCDPFDIDGECG